MTASSSGSKKALKPGQDVIQDLEMLQFAGSHRDGVLSVHAGRHGIGTASLTTRDRGQHQKRRRCGSSLALKGMNGTDKTTAQLCTDKIAAQRQQAPKVPDSQ